MFKDRVQQIIDTKWALVIVIGVGVQYHACHCFNVSEAILYLRIKDYRL